MGGWGRALFGEPATWADLAGIDLPVLLMTGSGGAANLLCRSNAPLARIAEDVGYQTDTAFSRAFRREYGSPPAAWRRRQVLGPPPV